jgi:hypothetical protein
VLAPLLQEHWCLEAKSRTVCGGNFKGALPKKQRTAVDAIACDFDQFFRLDPRVFPADELVATSEAESFCEDEMSQAF